MTTPPSKEPKLAEVQRLEDDHARHANWKRWGPYLSERQWGTVREDYSATGECWDYFSHDDSRSRAYRWGEDGLLGICDRQGRLCFALGLWNGKDGILKERLFGLTNPEGNHGEDVKEAYYYLDATPTYSYAKALYKYPQGAFPYQRLVEENKARGYSKPELELSDTGAFDEGRYFDVLAEYAKDRADDLYIRLTVSNRGPEAAPLWLLPQLWLRNTWSWGRTGEGYDAKPSIEKEGRSTLLARHANLGEMRLVFEHEREVELLFTENETNSERIFKSPNASPYVKDAFHAYVVDGKKSAVNPKHVGTKAAGLYKLDVAARSSVTVYLWLTHLTGATLDRKVAEAVFQKRIEEADAFYAARIPSALVASERAVSRQAYAGLLWSKQFYHYIVEHWHAGDPAQPAPPQARKEGRNADWEHLYNRDVVSMPDKWEYPWYAAWDLAFHMVPLARIDPDFAKSQLLLFLREWYMHPNGQIPAYEFAFGDVNPPVHAWAAWRVYKIAGKVTGTRDREWLKRVFQKLLINFTWWVNRKDADGNNLFSGGFLGLDNIGIFDRSQPLPTGGTLQQADGTAWMAFYCSTMLAIALELATDDPTYEDMASKFFEHFVRIVDAMNTLGGTGLWNEEDGFYYDQMIGDGKTMPLKTRSIVGVIPLFAVEVLDAETVDKLPGFKRRMEWFITNRQDLAKNISFVVDSAHKHHQLLAVPSKERLVRVLRRVLDETEFLSDYGVRALSRFHKDHPYRLQIDGREWRVDYLPGEGNSGAFGGNSNWRGPIWFPVNYLLIEALQRYHHFYGDSFTVECPVGSGKMLTLDHVAAELSIRLARIFTPAADGRRAVHGDEQRYAKDPAFKDLVLFYEYFHGDDGRGIGASHQTGWTSLVTRCLEHVAWSREHQPR
jgi:hypothetical protein